MGLNVPDRVHVIPVGYERDRVLESIRALKADKAILVGHNDNDKKAQEHWEYILEALSNSDIELETHTCDIFNLFESLGTIAELIYENSDDEVYINTATGSKVTAIAGMIASMVTDSKAYYAKAETYGGETPTGLESITELPKYPIDAPDENQVAVLEFINQCESRNKYPTKGELIHFSEVNGLSYMDRNVSGKGKYRLLDTHVIEPLQNEGYIEIIKEGRTKRVGLTKSGNSANQAFRYLIERDRYIWNPQGELESQ